MNLEEGSCNTCGAAGSVTCVVVKELDVSVLLSCDGDWQRGMTQHFVDLAGSVCVEADVRRTTLTFKTNNLRLSGLRAAADENRRVSEMDLYVSCVTRPDLSPGSVLQSLTDEQELLKTHQ